MGFNPAFKGLKTLSCYYCIASVVDEWMSMEHWWNKVTEVKQVLGRG